jgi:hypothetical protein
MSRTFRPKQICLSDDDDFEGHGAAVLLLVRNGAARNWTKLCHCFRFDRDPRAFHSGHLELKHTIEELIEAGLLQSKKTHLGPYKVTDKAYEALHALGASLTQVANMPYYGGLAVRPIFGKPQRPEKSAHAFVIMPFQEELRRVYDGPIRSACRKLHLSVERADDIFSSNDLADDIWNALVNSLVVIADCTNRNPNVFYELGIAHTLGKPAVMITQLKEDVPSDLRSFRYIEYSLSR